MASGHVNRTNRPNTWLHRPSLRRDDSSCQPGAVHTWHIRTQCHWPSDGQELGQSLRRYDLGDNWVGDREGRAGHSSRQRGQLNAGTLDVCNDDLVRERPPDGVEIYMLLKRLEIACLKRPHQDENVVWRLSRVAQPGQRQNTDGKYRLAHASSGSKRQDADTA